MFFFYRPDMDDILSVLTRVNGKVSNGIYRGYKQMPEPKYTFTKKLVLKPVWALGSNWALKLKKIIKKIQYFTELHIMVEW